MDYAIVMRSDGTLHTWGWSEYGPGVFQHSPKGNDFIDLAAGGQGSIVIRHDGASPGMGSMFGFGTDNGDRLNGNANSKGNDWISCKSGNKHFICMKADSSVFGFGGDTSGQTSSVKGNGFIAIAAGGYRNLALKADGSAVIFTAADKIDKVN